MNPVLLLLVCLLYLSVCSCTTARNGKMVVTSFGGNIDGFRATDPSGATLAFERMDNATGLKEGSKIATRIVTGWVAGKAIDGMTARHGAEEATARTATSASVEKAATAASVEKARIASDAAKAGVTTIPAIP